MQLKFKKLHKDAVIPAYAKPGDAGLDLTAIFAEVDSSDHQAIFSCKTGLAVEIPYGYVGLIFPRSSIYKTNLSMSNSVGVIDSGYRGEIMFKFSIDPDCYIKDGKAYLSGQYNNSHEEIEAYKAGDRVGQLIVIPYPTIEPVEVEELSESARGEGGFGSTGQR